MPASHQNTVSIDTHVWTVQQTMNPLFVATIMLPPKRVPSERLVPRSVQQSSPTCLLHSTFIMAWFLQKMKNTAIFSFSTVACMRLPREHPPRRPPAAGLLQCGDLPVRTPHAHPVPLAPARRARRTPGRPSLMLLVMVVVVLARRRLLMLQAHISSVSDVSYVCFCVSCGCCKSSL